MKDSMLTPENLVKFNRLAIRNKHELLDAIDGYLLKLDASTGSEAVPMGRIPALKELILQFKRKIEKTPLAVLDKPFTLYEVNIYDSEISLDIVDYEKIEFDEEGEIESSTELPTEGIVCVEAPLITLETYAQMHGVKPGTVRQWIRRGKLRNAVKQGSQWSIPSTEPEPKRGFEGGTYHYSEDDSGDLSDIFPLPKGSYSIWLVQLGDTSEEVTAYIFNDDDERIAEMTLNRSTREKLEHALAESPKVSFQRTVIDIIDRKVTSSANDEQDMHINAFQFLKAQKLSNDAQAIIDLVAYSSNAATLLTRIIERLGLEEDFTQYLANR